MHPIRSSRESGFRLVVSVSNPTAAVVGEAFETFAFRDDGRSSFLKGREKPVDASSQFSWGCHGSPPIIYESRVDGRERAFNPNRFLALAIPRMVKWRAG
jgi:hypothetical protein